MSLRFFSPVAVLLCVLLVTCRLGRLAGAELDPYEIEVGHSEGRMDFLQLETSLTHELNNNTAGFPRALYGDSPDSLESKMAGLGLKFGWLSKVLVMFTYIAFGGSSLWLLCYGLPSKSPRDAQMMGSTRLLVFLGTVQLFAYFTTDQYVPSLPQMGLELRGTQTQMSGSIQLNLFVKALVGMIVGPMSDHIGRKPILIMCLTLLILGSFACALAPDVNWFLAARIIQSLGESMEGMRLAIIRDCFNEKDRVFAIGMVTALMMIGPSVGPLLGGFIAACSHWRVPFFALGFLWSIFTLYAGFFITESAPEVKSRGTWQTIQHICGDRMLMTLLLADVCLMGTYLSYESNFSYLAEAGYGKSTAQTSLLLSVTPIAVTMGTTLLDMLNFKSVLQTVKFSVTFFTLAVTPAFAITGLYFSESFWAYWCSALVMAGSVACVIPLTALYMEPVEDMAGTAGALEILFSNGLGTVFSTASTEFFVKGGQRGLSIFHAGCSLLAGVVFWLGYATWPPCKEADGGDKLS
ncbi:ydgK [Symbiodinium sp. CCMP2456]|nr:ydgK [Symbiodinium sp. CCMP2456]